MTWSRVGYLGGALLTVPLYAIWFIVLSQSPALACECTDAHAIWWQEQHHTGGVVGALGIGAGGSSTAGLVLASVAGAAAIGLAVMARRNHRRLRDGTDRSH